MCSTPEDLTNEAALIKIAGAIGIPVDKPEDVVKGVVELVNQHVMPG